MRSHDIALPDLSPYVGVPTPSGWTLEGYLNDATMRRVLPKSHYAYLDATVRGMNLDRIAGDDIWCNTGGAPALLQCKRQDKSALLRWRLHCYGMVHAPGYVEKVEQDNGGLTWLSWDFKDVVAWEGETITPVRRTLVKVREPLKPASFS